MTTSPHGRVFGYYIDLDERGEFKADIRDTEGLSLLVIHSPDEDGGSIFEDGYMRHKEDIAGLQEYMISLGVLTKSDELLPMAEFETRIEAQKQAEPEQEPDLDFGM